jgi:hypothetical protein
MAGKYWWEDDSQNDKTQQGNGQTSSQDTKSQGYWWEDDSMATMVGNNITNRVNTWLKNHNNYISDYQKRYSSRKFNYEDSYVGDSAFWLDTVSRQKSTFDTEADSILAYMDKYKGYLNEDWVKSVRDTLTGARGAHSQIIDSATRDNEWWKKFTPNEDQTAAGYTAEKLYSEWQTGEKQYAADMTYDVDAGTVELEELKKERDAFLAEQEEKRKQAQSEDSFWDSLGRWLGTTPDTTIPLAGASAPVSGSSNAYDRQISELEAQINRAKYVQGYEAYMDNMDAEDYAPNSQYVSTRTDVALKDAAWGDLTTVDKSKLFTGDFDYNYINRHPDALGVANVNDTQSLAKFVGVDDSFLQTMSDDEIGVFNYLYKTQSPEAAYEFIGFIASDLKERKRIQEQESWANMAKESPVGTSAVSITMSPLKVVSALGQVADYIDDGTIDHNAGYNRFSYIPSSIRNQVATDIARSGKWGEVGSWTYQLGMSMGDFLMQAAVSGGNATMSSLLMGSGAMADTVISAKDRGLSDDQAMILGVVAGAAEIVTEKVSLDKLLNGDLSKGALRYILTNAFTEGTEEVSSSLINIVTDVLVSKDKSEWNMAVQDYLEKHPDATESEAFQKVLGDNILSLGLDFLGGSLMGGVMGSVGAGINYVTNAAPYIKDNKKARQQYGDFTKELIQEGLESDPNSRSYDLAKHYEKKTSKGKSLSGYEIRNLVEANEAQFVVENYEEALPLAKKMLEELGETQNIDKIAKLVAKKVSGQELTANEKSTLVRSQYGAKVAKKLTPTTSNLAYKSLEKRVGTEGRFGVSESGKATIRATDEEIDISTLDFATVGDGQATFKVAEGREVSAGDIDFADDNQSYMVSAISNIENITPAAATAMAHDIIDQSKPLGPQLNGIDEAFTYGYYNYSEADLKTGNFAHLLTNKQMMSAYKLGQAARKYSSDAKTETFKKMRTAAQAEVEKAIAEGKEAPKAKNLTITYNQGGGKVVSIEEAGITDAKQSGAVKVAKILHKMGFGTRVEFFSSYESETMKVKDKKTGKLKNARVFINDQGVEQIAYSGVYRKSDGTIRVDLHAYNGKDLTLNALAHELTHFIQQWSDRTYKVLVDFLMKEYENTDLTMHERVLREQKRLEDIRGEKVSYDEAYDEVVANAMSKMFDDGNLVEKLAKLKEQDKNLAQKLWEGFKEILAKFIGIYEKEGALFKDAADIVAMKETFEQLQNMFAEALVEASENYQAYLITKEAGLDFVTVEDVSQYSYSSLAEAAGFVAVENEDGTRSFTRDGKKVSKVTVEDIDNSPIGAFINFSVEMKDISEADAKRQKDMFAKICTMACKTNDFAMTMQFVGSAVFTGMKANADKQYGTTYDFPSICTKTQAVIDAMSAKMMSLGRGLKTDEIVQLYDDVFASGNPVPCPECYVFSRWIGIGGLLDNIKKYQDYYGNMAVEDVAAEYRKMRAEVAKFAEEQGISFGKAKGALTSKLTKEFNKLTEKIQKAENQGEKVKPADRNRLAELEPMMNTVKGMTWLENVYFADSSLKKVNPNFRVPDSVLFDLNNGEAFATQYKEAWAFRTTQGAGYGKAITPYAEARLGEGVLVTNNTTNAIKGRAQGSLNNYFLNQKGKLDKQSRDALKRARLKQKIQAFLGGQRFQSTSDARYENASDYLLAALEMQAMAGMVQCYTKVDGAVPAFSAWGFSINQSLMPLNGGLDADGNVKDTPVGGMKPSVAFENRKNHETAGTITIGVNDNHIRAMFKQLVRDFIIPYHASGGKADVVAEFRRIQEGKEAKGKAVRSTDYSRTQGDKVLSDEVLRWQGKTDAQIQRIHEIRNARIAILTGGKPNMTVVRSNRFLSALYDKFNGGEWDGVKVAKSKVESQIFPNEFWDQAVTYEESAKITKDYLEYCEDLGFLHRFSGTVPSNGKLIPVNGYNENGERVQLTDLAYKYDENGNKTTEVEEFFWKVLTDRRMYDNNGNYLAQKVVTLNDTTADTVTGFAKNNQGREYDKAKAEALAQKILKGEQYSEHDVEGFKDYDIVSAVYTIRNEKAKRGHDLVKIGNMPTLYRKLFGLSGDVYVSNEHLYQNMVSRATAESEGRFNPDASADYHELDEGKIINAIEQFQDPQVIMESLKDFNEPRLVAILDEKGSDGQNLIAVMELYAPIAYPGKKQRRNHVLMTIYEKNSLPDYIEKTADKDRILHIKEGLHQTRQADLQLVGAVSKETLAKNVARFNKKVKAFKEKNNIQYSSQETDADYMKAVNSGYMALAQEMVLQAAYEAGHRYTGLHGTQSFGFTKFDRKKTNKHGAHYVTDKYRIAESYSGVKGKTSISSKEARGNYFVTVDMKNPLVVECHGSLWNNIPFDIGKKGSGKDGKVITDDVVKYAEKKGYDGVIFKNLVDPGHLTQAEKIEILHTDEGRKKWTSNVYAVFNSNQIKSLDPVTYDDKGKVIPLSQRFNRKKDDIRYSSQETDLDTKGKKLGEDQLEYFEKSQVRDRNGRLQVVYHGGTVEFEFDTTRGGKGATQYGPGAYFTDSEYYAKEYTWYRGGDVKDYYLKIEKMFDDTNMDATVQMPQWKKLEQILRDNGIEDKFIERFKNGGFAYMSRYLALKAGAKTSSSWEGSEQLNAMLREAGFDGIKGDLNDVYQYVIFTPNQAKLTTNEVPSTFYDTRYSSQETDADYITYDRTAILKEDTVDRWLRCYATKSSQKYAQAYIAYMNPDQFLELTTSDYAARKYIESESYALDEGKFAKATSDQPLFLDIDHETGEVYGHEGRHRCVALQNAGIENVPVLLFDTSNKYSKEDISSLLLKCQFNKYHREFVFDAIPLSYENRDRVIQNFATQSSAQRFWEKNGTKKTLRYSEHETDYSNRSLLANAFEGITKSSAEYGLIQEYKGHIRLLNEYEEKLNRLNAEIRKIRFTSGEYDAKKLRELEAEAKNTAKAINRHDQKLLWLEASEPLRKLIEHERKKEAQKTKAHVKEIQQNKKLRAEQTELRHKIRKAIRDLDKILNRGNKKLNVKEDMQNVVSKALQAADILFTDNYGTYDMLRNGLGVDLSDSEEALVKTCTQMLKDLDKMPTDGYDNWQARQEAENKLRTKMSKLSEVFARERKRLTNTKVSSILGELADAYKSIETSDKSYVQGAYSEPVYNFLKNLQSEVGGVIVTDMTKDQLESVYAAYKMVLNTVRNANKMFNEELKQSREQLGNAVIEEVLKAGGVHLLGTKMGDAASQFSWNNMKPIWVANRIGSDTFSKLMGGLFKGQYNFAVDIDEAKKFKLEMDKKYSPRNWDAEKQYKFTSSTGKEFSLNLQQIMSLYAFSKREQAYSHLLNGGFVFEENSTVVVDGKLGIKKTYIHKGAASYKLNEATLNGIINSLTAEQKAYVDEMQKYLSDVMGAKGNEVSMQLYGIKMFNEQFYFPLRSSGAYMERAKEAEMKKQQGQINLVNSGFTHAVKPEAKNPIILSGFMDVWAEHCNEMSMYHSMVLPMEDFRKVYNYSTIHDEKMESASVYQTIQDAYGTAATNYIDQLYRELNAGATVDPRETPWKKLISNFKKSAVMLSGSVVVQQFSSIGRAYAVIDPKYFIGTKVNSDTKLSVVEEMKKYAPVAIIKEMGGFDTGTKGNAKSYIMAERYGKGERIKGLVKDSQYRGDIMGFLPAWADEKTWCAIWEAVKRETKAKNPKMDVKSDVFLKLAGERFSEVIEKTQVYDSVLARSANMRSKGNFMAMATAFMAEPTTTINLLEDAIRSGNAKNIAKAFGSVAVAIVLNNALASIVYAMRDDDEDETFLEKYFQSLTSGMIDDINPMSYYPFLKDVYSLFQGYDVERTDMAVFADIRDALKRVVSLLGKDTSEMDDDELAEHYKLVNEALMGILDAGCSAFGVPVKNVRRDVNGIINAWNTLGKDLSDERDNSWISFWDKVGAAAKDTIPVYAWKKDKSKNDKLYDAIISGDKDYIGRLKSTYKTEDAYTSAVRKALRENDPRIHEAALARYEGRTEEYKRIFREIKNEGKFSFDDIMSAVNSEESKIRNKVEPDKVTSDYTATDFVESIVLGDTKSAQAIRDDIIASKMANGKTQDEAEKEFTSSVTSGIRDAYSSGLLDDAGAKEMLLEYVYKEEEDKEEAEEAAISKVSYWAFCEEYPKYKDVYTEAHVAKYYEFGEPAGISVDVYAQYIEGTKGLSTKYDEWGDVEVSKRDQVLEAINSLPLTWEQKDALYLAAGYAESEIWNVPW